MKKAKTVTVMEERHTPWIRICHWINMISITLLILTGFYINTPLHFRLFSNMDFPRILHFAMAFVLCFGVLLRVYYAIATKDSKNIIFSFREDIKKLPSMLKYYLFLSDTHPYYGKYNPGQKMMYTGWFILILIQILTGFMLYNPNAFLGLGGLLGGMMVVRMIHLVITWLFVITVALHVYLDVSEGIPVLKSMFTGKIPADFDHGVHETEEPADEHNLSM